MTFSREMAINIHWVMIEGLNDNLVVKWPLTINVL